jgi:hypothetical protein
MGFKSSGLTLGQQTGLLTLMILFDKIWIGLKPCKARPELPKKRKIRVAFFLIEWSTSHGWNFHWLRTSAPG